MYALQGGVNITGPFKKRNGCIFILDAPAQPKKRQPLLEGCRFSHFSLQREKLSFQIRKKELIPPNEA